MKTSFALGVYGLVTWLAQPMLRRKLRRRAKAEPGYAHAIGERFGHYGPALDADVDSVGWIWIHAVSLGEARAAGILMTALRQAEPDVRVLLTHGTATGRAEGATWLRAGDLQVWQPWDSPGAVARFFDRFKPRIGVLMETEVWPQLTAACAARGIPLVLANARLNAKSLASAQRLAWLARPAYAALTAAWAQSEADASRLALLGARVDGVFGNLKFDAAPDTVQLAEGQARRAALARPVVMLASSREGEEKQLLDVIGRLVAGGSPAVRDVQWLIVPRHPQRFDEVAALIYNAGFTPVRRSTSTGMFDLGSTPGTSGAEPIAVWLGDSLGEMALYYALSDVALLGGSFEPLGGQNLIEAAACGCPIVLGPSTFNFADAATLALAAGAATRVADMEKGVGTALALVAEPGRRQAMAQAAVRFASAHRGAAKRTAHAVLALLSARVKSPG